MGAYSNLIFWYILGVGGTLEENLGWKALTTFVKGFEALKSTETN